MCQLMIDSLTNWRWLYPRCFSICSMILLDSTGLTTLLPPSTTSPRRRDIFTNVTSDFLIILKWSTSSPPSRKVSLPCRLRLRYHTPYFTCPMTSSGPFSRTTKPGSTHMPCLSSSVYWLIYTLSHSFTLESPTTHVTTWTVHPPTNMVSDCFLTTLLIT